MFNEIEDYINYISNMHDIHKPKMPKFDLDAYTDSEYTFAIKNVIKDYENIDDYTLTIDYLLGKF